MVGSTTDAFLEALGGLDGLGALDGVRTLLTMSAEGLRGREVREELPPMELALWALSILLRIDVSAKEPR